MAIIDGIDEICDASVSSGIDGVAGGPLYRSPRPEDIARELLEEARESFDFPSPARSRRGKHQRHLGGAFDEDSGDLAEVGWAAILPAGGCPEVREALAPLLEHRRGQATGSGPGLFRVFEGPDGYRPGESRLDFLTRHGVGPGVGDPALMPRFLLLVGGPDEIPWEFQHDLALGHAVGRLSFDAPAHYARYAERVVAIETEGRETPRRAAFFAPRHPEDRTSELICEYLAGPLAQAVAAKCPTWSIESLVGAEATREKLLRWLAGESGASFLFAACHGVGFPCGDPLQRGCQGALLCADSAGPAVWRGPVPKEHFLNAAAVGDGARPPAFCFFFACHGAGTPRLTSYPEPGQEGCKARRQLAPEPLAAELPRRLLSLPEGSLAVVGHIERSFCYSFLWPQTGPQIGVFQVALRRLLAGVPVGAAFRSFPERYAELAMDIASLREAIDYGAPPDLALLGRLQTALTDARGYAILGDPAVRMRVAGAS